MLRKRGGRFDFKKLRALPLFLCILSSLSVFLGGVRFWKAKCCLNPFNSNSLLYCLSLKNNDELGAITILKTLWRHQ